MNRILESISALSDEYDMIYRVGPKGTTPRPVKIKLKNQDDQTKIPKAAKNLKGHRDLHKQRHDPFRASRAQETGDGTKEKKGGSTIKRAVGNPLQQSDQCSKSGARAGSGLQHNIPIPKPGRSSSNTIIVGTQGNKHVQDVISAPTLNAFKNRLDETWINYKYCTDLDWFKNPNLKETDQPRPTE